MKNTLSEQERLFLIEALQKGEPIPLDFKYKLFPISQKEYELNYAGKMRKQDILRGEDGVLPVPLQIEKVFNGDRDLFSDGWRNMIVFGDNLQFLKTCYQNTDELIKDKVKGKVKLIYIDPPFGTSGDFNASSGQKGYTDKKKDSDFVEYIRRRLIVAKELVANDGNIVVHLDNKKSHHIKLILDEVFGENNFLNEVIWKRSDSHNDAVRFGTVDDRLLIYKRSESSVFYKQFIDYGEKYVKDFYKYIETETGKKYRLDHFTKPKGSTGYFYDYNGRKPPPNGWRCPVETMIDFDNKGLLVFSENRVYKKRYLDEQEGKALTSIWDDVTGQIGNQSLDYPTQKPEMFLQRIINSFTKPNDIIIDFFGGSGTTAAVSEKLGRKWIVCDIGKLSFYTMQKRILTIEESKDLNKSTTKYSKKAKSFITVNVGYYDLGKLFELGKEKYITFVLNLFEIEPYKKPKTIKGYEISGERNGSYCFVWEFWKYKSEANVDIDFLEELHEHLKNNIGKRFYIVAPANAVDFISDYWEIDDTRYYFLKVPYQIIQELHKEQFKKHRQPQSKNKINDVEDAIGFHFTRQPEVKSSFENGILKVLEFRSNYTEEGTDREMDNFESLSMVIIDKNFNGKEFAMNEYHFAADLIHAKKGQSKNKAEEIEDEDSDNAAIQAELKQQKELTIPINGFGERICIKYIDIYGNEFTEELKNK